MLAGQLPFDASDVTSFFLKHLKERPVPLRNLAPHVPEGLERIVMELLEKDPKDRPVDAHRVRADLTAIAEALRIRVPPEFGHEEASSRGPNSGGHRSVGASHPRFRPDVAHRLPAR